MFSPKVLKNIFKKFRDEKMNFLKFRDEKRTSCKLYGRKKYFQPKFFIENLKSPTPKIKYFKHKKIKNTFHFIFLKLCISKFRQNFVGLKYNLQIICYQYFKLMLNVYRIFFFIIIIIYVLTKYKNMLIGLYSKWIVFMSTQYNIFIK